jgi:hypothetical protein
MAEKIILVIIDDVPSFNISIGKNNTIRDLKSSINNVISKNQKHIDNSKVQLFLNADTESKVFNTDKYDKVKFRSVWDSLNNSYVKIITSTNSTNSKLTGIRDVDNLILKNLNDKDLFSFCLANNSLCPNEDFWRNRFLSKYGEEGRILKLPKRTWKNFYLLITHYDEKYTNGKALYEVAKKGYLDLAQFFLAREQNNLDEALGGAAAGGNRDLVDFFISQGHHNWYYALRRAAEAGRKDLVDFFISKAHVMTASDYNFGLHGAATGGHKDLIDFFIKKGARNWKLGLAGAVEGGHKDLVDFFLKKIKGKIDWDYVMGAAARGGHKNLVDFAIEKGPRDLGYGLQSAAEGGHKDLVDFFIAKGANSWRSALYSAQDGGHKEMIKFFENKIKNSK